MAWHLPAASPLAGVPTGRAHGPMRHGCAHEDAPGLHQGQGRLRVRRNCCFTGVALALQPPRRLGRGFGVAQVVVAEHRQLVVQLVDERDAGRDVQGDDVLLRDAVEVLHQRSQAVAVGRDHARSPALTPARWWPASTAPRGPRCPSGTRSGAAAHRSGRRSAAAEGLAGSPAVKAGGGVS